MAALLHNGMSWHWIVLQDCLAVVAPRCLFGVLTFRHLVKVEMLWFQTLTDELLRRPSGVEELDTLGSIAPIRLASSLSSRAAHR